MYDFDLLSLRCYLEAAAPWVSLQAQQNHRQRPFRRFTRLKEENNTSWCTGAWERPCPSMGCLPAGAGSASTSASLSPRVMTQGWSPHGTHCWETRVHTQGQRRAHPDSSPLGGRLAAHQLVCRTLPSHRNLCTKTRRRDKCHGGHRVQQEPHHCPPPGERCPQRHWGCQPLRWSARLARLLSSHANPMGTSTAPLLGCCPILSWHLLSCF